MPEFDDSEIHTINIEDELRQSYLDYAMSVIVGRALPDVRDGLKPVHRRVLFAMSDLNNAHNRPYMKSARIVGDVIGKYHPHGDTAAYDTIVRMAQDFNMRYPLVDGQGNFGSLDGDGAAAMRYTEIRMHKIAHELLADLDKETVDFVENYDNSLEMPAVLPAKIPNLLVNGSSGIAVGMATNIPPHNLKEVVSGCLALVDNPEIGVDELMEHIPGPDFPTGGIINGRGGVVMAYRTGRGRIRVRARCDIEVDAGSGRETIIIREIPYQVNRARLIEKIATLVKDRKIEGISGLRDESAVDTRVLVELRRGYGGEVVLNNLYAQTQLQSVFGINIVALVDGEPKVLSLKQTLEQFVLHRREVITRRTVYLLRRAKSRGHLLEGLAVALSNIDAVIALIKDSAVAEEARNRLVGRAWRSETVTAMLERAGPDAARPEDLGGEYGLRDDGNYYLSPGQAQAILEMRLNRLTGLEQDRLIEEYREIIDTISDLLEILGSQARLMRTLREELVELLDEYSDERRTEIIETEEDLTMEDLITEQEMMVTVSASGYAKTQPLDSYSAQRRGGKGKSASAVKEEDHIEYLLAANTHDTILCFTDRGRVYWLRVFLIPPASRAARGRPLVNLLPLDGGERITTMLPVSEYRDDRFVFLATRKGTVKKMPLTNFSRPRHAGVVAIRLVEGDAVVGATVTDGSRDIMLFGSGGRVVRFGESEVRPTGRAARGVRGVRLKPAEKVVALMVPEAGGEILVASRGGYGKRSAIADYPVKGRGGSGVIGMKLSARNGEVVAATQVFRGDELMLISDQGTLVRIRCDEVSRLGRNTQGVRLINLTGGERLVGMAPVAASGSAKGGEAPGDTDAGTDNDGPAAVTAPTRP